MANNNLLPDLVNGAYNTALVTAGTVAISELTQKITKSKVPKIDFGLWDMTMLGLDIGAAMGIVQALKNNGIIPDKIMTPKNN